jgi:hypothetical protein
MTFLAIILIHAFCMNVAGNLVCQNKTSKYLLQCVDSYTYLKTPFTFFQNFKTFTELYMDCNQTYNAHSSVVQFRPNRKILIDETFSLTKLINSVHLYNVHTLVMFNIKGIDLNSRVIESTHLNNLALVYSLFSVYTNSTQVNECNAKGSRNFISSFKSIYFRQTIYSKSICPLIFNQSSLELVYFTDITNSYLIKNKLKFDNSSQKVTINTLKTVYFELNYERLTLDNFDVNLFKYTQSLFLVGILESIDTDLFSYFKNLKIIDFKINNLDAFFQQGNKWLPFLNSNINVNMSSEIEIKASIKSMKFFFLSIYQVKAFQSFIDMYTYPNEDICLFKDFPHHHLVFPFIFPDEKLECTCTLKWLNLYVTHFKLIDSNTYTISNNNENRTNIYYDCREAFKALECDFERTFLKCDKNIKIKHRHGISNDVDLFYLIKWLEYILILILQPILCSLTILSNLMIILVLKNNYQNHAQLKDKMYKYALVNACFNIVFATLMLFKLANTCVFSYSNQGYQCSSVYQEETSQWYKIVGVYYLGNAFKYCSNISYIFFSMSRFISVSLETKNRFFIQFNRINVKAFVLIVLSLSLILSVFILYQYEINDVFDYRKEFPYEKRDGHFCLVAENQSQCHMFNVFKLINQAFNGILFLILSIVIDIFLVYVFRKEMKQKSMLEVNKNKGEEFKKKTEKVTKMVFINNVVYFVSHFPSFIITLFLILYSKRMAKFCTERISCDILNEEAEVFLLVSMISNYFMFLYFNRNFNESFQDLKYRFLKRLHFKKFN